MKNEGTFLLEWVAYHRVIGFSRIVVFTNDCTDGSDDLLDALAEIGAVEHVRHTPAAGVSAQASAAGLVNDRGLLRDGEWVLWLDGDEFLNINVGNRDLPSLIAEMGEAKGILVQWRCFGDNGHARFPGRHISENFVTASRKKFLPNLEIKTLFKVGPWIAGLSDVGINRPALNPAGGAIAEDFLTGAGRPLDSEHGATRHWIAGESPPTTRRIAWRERGWQLAQINHYIVRTPEHFRLKAARGRGWRADSAGARNNRHTADFYLEMNQNDAVDRSILVHMSAVTAEMSRLLSHDPVAAAQARCHHLTQTALEEFANQAHPLEIARLA